MSAQTTYKYSSSIGSPGGIVDLAPHAIDSFLNGENTGVMKLGVGVVQGSNPGTNVVLPTTSATAATFEGVTVNNRTTEYDMEGKVHLRKGKALGVMRYGRIYVRVANGAAPTYGATTYVVTSGNEVGYFTNSANNGQTGDDRIDYLAVKGRFLGGVDSNAGIAEVELFNQAQA